MSNVIELKPEDEKDFKHVSYYEMDTDVGLAMRDKSLIVMPLNSGEFEVFLGDNESVLFKREELAEFLHVACVLVDSENRYNPDVDKLIGRDY